MESVSLALAFVAGLVSFASPCVLALVPVYLAFLGDAAGTTAGTSAVAIPRSAGSRSEWSRRSQFAERMLSASCCASTRPSRPAANRWMNAAEARSPEGPPPTPSATATPHADV